MTDFPCAGQLKFTLLQLERTVSVSERHKWRSRNFRDRNWKCGDERIRERVTMRDTIMMRHTITMGKAEAERELVALHVPE